MICQNSEWFAMRRRCCGRGLDRLQRHFSSVRMFSTERSAHSVPADAGRCRRLMLLAVVDLHVRASVCNSSAGVVRQCGIHGI
jgi:hypothetical protein